MPKKILILGELNLKLFLPFGLTAFQIIVKVISQLFPEESKNIILETYSMSFGQMLIRLMPLILKITPSQIKEEKPLKRKFLYYSLLVLVNILTIVMKIIVESFKGEMSELTGAYNPIADYEFIKLSIEMICLRFISRILLKYKYFIHHVLSIVIFVIIGNICDIIIDKYEKLRKAGFYNFLDILAIIIDSLYYCYIKYLMDKIFIQYWNIGLTLGLTLTFFATILLLVALIDKDKSASDNALINTFYKSFQQGNIGIIILKQFTLIFLNFLQTCFTILTAFYFEPSFILISYEFSKFYQVLKDYPEKAYIVVFFIVQFFCLMILLEIVELNFCGLNKNTKRSISQRGIDELLGDIGRESSIIDINKDYYYINKINDNEIKGEIELNDNSYKEKVGSISESVK